MANLYYNLSLSNNDATDKPMIFTSQSAIPFITNASEWKLCVIRFSIPNYQTPIFKFVDGAYLITMSYKHNYVTQPVLYSNHNSYNTPQNVYEVQHFVDMLNDTIISVQKALYILDNTLPFPTAYPYFGYDKPNHLISYYFYTQHLDTVPSPIYLYMNDFLERMLFGMLTRSSTIYADAQWRIICEEDGTNEVSTGLYRNMQEASSFDNMTDLNTFTMSTSLPVHPEYFGSDIRYPMLTDFTPDEITANNFSSRVVYNAVFPYRFITLVQNTSIVQFDITCWTTDAAGSRTLMMIPPGSSANIKLMFTHI